MAKLHVGVPEGDERYGAIEAFDNFVSTMFPDGLENLPDRDVLLKKVQDGLPLTLRETLYARFFNEGLRIPEDNVLLDPELSNPEIVEKAQTLLNHFGVAPENAPIFEKGKGWDAQLKPIVKNNLLDTDVATVEKDSKIAKGVRTTVQATGKATLRFKELKFAPLPENIGVGGKFDSILSDDGLKAITRGIASIPDPNVRQAVWVGIFGSRGTATANIALNKRIAAASGQRTQYYDPKTKILYGMETNTRKGLPPTRTLDGLTTALLSNRWDDASQAKEIRIFKDVTSSDISDALRTYVFTEDNFPTTEIDRLGRQPVGITDMRKLIGSWMANRLGNANLADGLLAHTGGDDIDELVSTVGRRYYLTIEDDPKKYGEFMERAVQEWMKEVGATDYQDFANKLGFQTAFEKTGVPQLKNFAEIDSKASEGFVAKEGDPEVKSTVFVELSEAQKASNEEAAIAHNKEAAQRSATTASQLKTEQLKADLENEQLQQDLAEKQANAPSKSEIKQTNALNKIKDTSSEGFGDVIGGALDDFFEFLDSDEVKKLKGFVAPLVKPSALVTGAVTAGTTALDVQAREAEAQQDIAQGKSPLAARLQQGIGFGVALTPPGAVKEIGEVAVEAGFEAAGEAATEEAEEKGLQDLNLQDRLLRSLTGF